MCCAAWASRSRPTPPSPRRYPRAHSGASGQIGLGAVARAPADGYTLTASPASLLTTNKAIFRSLPYDPQADFVPVTRRVNQPMVLVVKDKQKFPSVAAVVAAARAPGAVDGAIMRAPGAACAPPFHTFHFPAPQ